MKKIWYSLIVAIIIAASMPKLAYAGDINITVDGKFDDWNNIDHTDISGRSGCFDKVAFVYDEKYLYLHVKEKSSKNWENNLPLLSMTADNSSKNFVLLRYKNQNLKDGLSPVEIANDWWVTIRNSEGALFRSNGYNEWEIKVPVNEIFMSNEEDNSVDNVKDCNINSLDLSWQTGGAVSIAGTYIGNIAPTVTPSPTPDPGNTGNPGSSAIMIDGYFDDWENKPKTDIYWNKGHVNKGSLFKDSNYIYLYIELSNKSNYQVAMDSYVLTVNNNQYNFFIRYKDSSGTIDWNRSVYNLSKGIYTGLSPFIAYPYDSLGDAAVSVSTGSQNNRLEIRINIQQLEQVLGLEDGLINSAETISISNPNLGGQEVIITGISTGPVIGIVVVVSSVVLLYVVHTKRRKSKV